MEEDKPTVSITVQHHDNYYLSEWKVLIDDYYLPVFKFDSPAKAVDVAAKLASAAKSNGMKISPVVTIPVTDLLIEIIDSEIDNTIDAFSDDPDPEISITDYIGALQSIPIYRLYQRLNQHKSAAKTYGPDHDYNTMRKERGLELLIDKRTPAEAIAQTEAEIAATTETGLDIEQASALYDALSVSIEVARDEMEEWDVSALASLHKTIAVALCLEGPA